MTPAPIPAHSIVEVQLFLRVARCRECQSGPLRCEGVAPAADSPCVLELRLTCASCAMRCTQWVELPEAIVAPDPELFAPERLDASAINSTEAPSNIIDVGQWILLATMLSEAASRETDRRRSREFGMLAGQCLGEALKFFTDADNDLPPPEAFFDDASRRRFRESPAHFSRARIAGWKAKLPRPYAGSRRRGPSDINRL